MSSEQNRAIMDIYLNDVLANRNYDRIPEIAGADMVDHTQPGSKGPDALDAHARGFCANTPDVKIDVIQIIADEDSVAGIWRWNGTTHQPSAVSAKGSPVYPHVVCSIFQIKEGKIQDYQVFVDAVDVFTQLAQ